MVRRGELTDAAWERISPFLPENGGRGKQWGDHRRVINGILWRLRIGAPLAGGSGTLRPVANLLRPLRSLAARRDLGEAARGGANPLGRDGRDRVGGERGLKRGPSAPARGGGREKEEPQGRKKGLVNPPDEALGRSRGGFSTKLHLSCDGRGRPLSLVLTCGQRNDSTQLGAVLDAIRVPRAGRGRPRKRPSRLVADKGYSYPSCRELLRKRGVPHTIPERSDQHASRASTRKPTAGATWWSGAWASSSSGGR